MWESLIKGFYYHLYFFIGLGSIFIFVLLCCMGKKAKKNKLKWTDVFQSIHSLTKRKTITKKHESECRRIMEDLFKAPFTSIRPDFLKYHTGRNLELDGYNEALGIAFEYQGIQHRKFTPMFHKTYQHFLDQIKRDTFKKNICLEKGIQLICIPDEIPFSELKEYITNYFKK